MTWVPGRMRNCWMTFAQQPVKNVDLWKQLQAVCERHTVEWHWVKGHAADANELADHLGDRCLEEAAASGVAS